MPPEERPGRRGRRRRLREIWTQSADQWRAKFQGWANVDSVSPLLDEISLSVYGGELDAQSRANDVTVVQELLSYGLLLVLLLSTVFFLSPYWADMGRGGHLSVAALVAGDAITVGSAVIALDGASARRLGGLLWLIATVGFATLVSDVTAAGPDQLGLRLFVVGLTVLLTSVLLWRNQDRPLQFLSAVTGCILVLCGASTMMRLHPTSTQLALFVCCCALALGLASLYGLRPAPTALVVAELGGDVGALALSFPHPLGGVIVGIVTTIIAVALGAVLVRPFVLVLGALGFFMFDIRAFSIYLRSSSAAIGAGVLGLIIVCVGLWHAVHTESRERREVQSRQNTTVEHELLEPS